MRNFRSNTSFYASKSTIIAKIEEPIPKPGPIGLRYPTMGLANAPMASAVFSWSLRFLWKSRRIWKKLAKNCRLRVKIWEIFLKSPRFLTPETFLRNRLKVKIYTDACAKSPFESESINWDYGIGIGGILAINGNIVEFSSLEVNERIPPWLKGPNLQKDSYVSLNF